jgi:hypothetical protein
MTSSFHSPGGRFRIGKVFGSIFAVIGRNIWLWLGLTVILMVLPALLLQFVVFWSLGRIGIDLTGAVWLQFGAVLVIVVLVLLLQSALIRATIEDMGGKRPSFGDCIGTAFSVLLPMLGIAFLAFAAVFLILVAGSMLLGAVAPSLNAGASVVLVIAMFVPVTYLLLRWVVAIPVLVQERRGVFASMARSAALTKGSRWALLGLFAAVVLASFVAQLVLGIAAALLGAITGLVVLSFVQALLSTIISTAAAVSYVELREVREGTSVTELAEIFS